SSTARDFVFFFFFFSSRRRHTRCLSDWSSDVCSSDLDALAFASVIYVDPPFNTGKIQQRQRIKATATEGQGDRTGFKGRRYRVEIGRASCRERVEMWGVAGGGERKRKVRRRRRGRGSE